MQPGIYEEQMENPKKVFLKLKINSENNVVLCAVDDVGDTIAELFHFIENEILACEGACERLAREGYDMQFAQWTPDGAAIVTPF